MPVTFGSVGDIIAVVQLFSDLVTALRDCRGSAHDFQLLTQQLQVLAVTVQEVDNIIKLHEAAPELDALRQSLGYIAAACQTSATAFYDQIKKYQASLRPGGSGNSVRDAARKAQWRMLESSDVERFRAELVAHTSSLRALLTLWNIKVSDSQHAKMHQSLDAITTAAQSTNQTQEGLLRQLLSRIDQAVDVSQRTNVALQYIAAASRLGWLRAFAGDMIMRMTALQQCTFNIYNNVLEVNTNLSILMRETLLGGYGCCTLVDAFGRELPMHLEFINSWEVFDAVMEARFRSRPGYTKVLDRDFALRDDRSRRDILRERPWDGAVKAGQHINMEMVFRESTEQELEVRLCPGCDSPSEQSGCSFQCPSCGMQYSTEIEKRVVTPRSTAPSFTRAIGMTTDSTSRSRMDHPSDFVRVRMKLKLLTGYQQTRSGFAAKQRNLEQKDSRISKRTSRAESDKSELAYRFSERAVMDDEEEEDYYIDPSPVYRDEEIEYEYVECHCTDCISPNGIVARKATLTDAHRAHIPAGFNYGRWDPTREPILMDDMVFDTESLRTWQEQRKEATDQMLGDGEPRDDWKWVPHDAHEITLAMELARQQLKGLDSRSASEADAEVETLDVSRRPATLRPDKLDIKMPSFLDLMPSSQLPIPPKTTEMEHEDTFQGDLSGGEDLAI